MSWLARPCPVPDAQAYYDTNSRCAVILAHEPVGPAGELRWHLSISHAKRYPSWNEIAAARYHFVPDAVTMAMILPPRAEYVNLHKNCFHLYEWKDPEVVSTPSQH